MQHPSSFLQYPLACCFRLLSKTFYMFQYRRYNIRNTDQFHPDDFPKVVNELSDINNGTAGLPAAHKGEMLISFLKDRSIKSDLLNENPALAGLITSRHFETTHLESLFDSCHVNNEFARELETYIRKNIS